MSRERTLILGAGHAGGRAALALRAAGYTGDITLVGEEEHPPYERPPLSKDFLSGKITAERTYLKPSAAYADNGIDLQLRAHVDEIDAVAARVRLTGGETLAYDKLLLTTGARPRRLAFTGSGAGRVLYLRNLEDAEALRAKWRTARRCLVIGGGLIGLEIAATMRVAGCEVIVVEAGATLLGRVATEEIGAWFAERHRSQGITLHLAAQVEEILEHANGLRVRLSGGDELECDLAVVGIGATPNDELAREAGLEVDDGVLVDAAGCTSNAAIFAAGDVARAYRPALGRRLRLETWRNAHDQSVAVAKAIAGHEEIYDDVPWMWTDQFGFNMQMAGSPAKGDTIVWRGSPDDQRFMVFHLRDGVVVAANALNNARDMRAAMTMIKRGARIDPNDLADPTRNLTEFAR